MQTAPQFGRRGVATAAATVAAVAATVAATPRYGGVRSPAPSPVADGGDSMLPLILGYFFSFKGRLRRSLYWICQISATVAFTSALLAVISIELHTKGNLGAAMLLLPLSIGIPVLSVWTGLAVTAKRWHDRYKSWPWLFVALLPLVGPIWALIECGFLDGTPGPNRFGPSPKGDLSAVFE